MSQTNGRYEDAAFEVVRPDAAAMIESLRAFGYSPQSAVADLIDNSISAGARNVWITPYWNGSDSHVLIEDDGHGMDAAALTSAMRLGSTSPLEERAGEDLGRFGLGLKTASFSQCRRLTVGSKEVAGHVEIRRWDLDHVNRTSDWQLLKAAAPGSVHHFHRLGERASGTVVLWEQLDRLVGDSGVEDRKAADRFLRVVEEIDRHLGMVFHRFLQGRDRLTIHINGSPVRAWDPFLSDAPATQWLEEEVLKLHGEEIRVQPFVLPHHSRLDPEAHSNAAGIAGWNAQQGFYIYRNRRLLVAGDWLGLFKKEEHHKLARIRIDIPNVMDHAWHIDVRKSRARPPGVLRDEFRRIASVARGRAVAIYRNRGKVVAHTKSEGFVSPWQRMDRRGKIFYKVNREHPLVRAVLSIPAPHRTAASALVRLVEETVPVPLIAIDHAERPDEQATPFEQAASEDVLAVLQAVYRALIGNGMSRRMARERVRHMEPFRNYPELLGILDEEQVSEDATERSQ